MVRSAYAISGTDIAYADAMSGTEKAYACVQPFVAPPLVPANSHSSSRYCSPSTSYLPSYAPATPSLLCSYRLCPSAMLLLPTLPYAMSATQLLPMQLRDVRYCPRASARIVLGSRYAMSGTDLAYGATSVSMLADATAAFGLGVSAKSIPFSLRVCTRTGVCLHRDAGTDQKRTAWARPLSA
eukprot:554374-Rhodomonas_salina.2